MTTTLKWFSAFFLSLGFLSCAETPTGVMVKEVPLIDQSGLFRGYQMGMRPDSLLYHESWIPDVKSDSLVKYHKDVFIISDTVPIDVYLAFDSYGLFEIQVDLFADDDSLATAIVENWSSTLTNAFGDSEDLIMAKRWTTYSPSNNTVEVTLSQERNDQSRRFLSLNYLEPLDDEF